ncbi:histidine-rich protein PFHRP-II [Musca domestica]|uniref:Cuticle protein n=1 Tax=Musca domestica TaxID=7370 RepID=T1PH08_MUSDO|nr:histidine-rich protein PFHRP-II [Musca domestica]
MKVFIIATALLVATCSASYHGAVSTQYASLDPHSHSYSYGYSDPNSQKHETRSHDGVTHGSYSYVDGHGHVQSVHYTADPHTGFHATGTNLPKGPAPLPALAHAAAYDGGHYAAGHAYHGPLAHITLTHEGVPHDTPEVAHAKAAHAAAYAAAAAAAAHSGDGGHHHLYKRSLWGGHAGYAHVAAPVVLTHGGVPVDTPDVQAAKAAHYAAHAKALGAAGHGHGAPLDTPEVSHAKAAHFAAHAAARSGHPGAASHAVAAHGFHIPVIHNGVPVETPEVQHAKAAHFAAVAKAAATAGPADHGDDGHYDGRWDGDHAGGHGGAPSHYATSAHHTPAGPYHGPLHIPVIHNGVPVEPAEVQHARAAHLNALAAESHNSVGHGYYGKW